MDEIVREVWKDAEKIREVYGIEAFDRIMDLLFRMQLRIEELKKSRDNWKKKYQKSREEMKKQKNTA